MTSLDFAEITKTTPEKSLLKPLPKSGRNNQGKLTVRHHEWTQTSIPCYRFQT